MNLGNTICCKQSLLSWSFHSHVQLLLQNTFLNEIFASRALHLRLQLSGFIEWLNLEIQIQCITFRCYPEDFGILIGRPEGKWRNLSHLLRKHSPKVAEQVCDKERTNTLDYCHLHFPILSCPLSFALSLNFLLLMCQTVFIILHEALIQCQDLLLLPACWPVLPTGKSRISNSPMSESCWEKRVQTPGKPLEPHCLL